MAAMSLRAVQERIVRAAESCGRDPATITLIAVSKTVPIEKIREAYDQGQRHFGESRLQEAIPKIESLPNDIVWHFIGKLQSNKAKRAAQLFDVIHTLESEAQMKEIAKAGRRIDGLIEVNIGDESQKSGVSLDALANFHEIVLRYELVNLRGLMSVGPAHPNAELMRPYFQAVAEANRRMSGDWLSLGMSNDFEVAIQEGSTHIRVGSALFGARG
jgi:PLP dependent protein